MTESVAVLALLGSKDRPSHPLLYSLVFGESVFNDAVSIVLYGCLHTFTQQQHFIFTSKQILESLWLFFAVSFGSIALGIACGLLCSCLMKHIHLHTQPEKELLVVLLVAFMSYCVSEVLSFSGVMSLFFCGIVLAHYNWYNLSSTSRASTLGVFTALAKGAETLVFVYLGLTLPISCHHTSTYTWSPRLVLVTFALCLATRALYVFPASWLDNLRRRPEQSISGHMQLVIWISGMRGSVAFALALNLPNTHQGALVTATLAVCLVSLAAGGLLVDWMLTKFQLVGGIVAHTKKKAFLGWNACTFCMLEQLRNCVAIL